ncbi:hypothetical protein [Aquimarina addita]|uniref:hypothetical protein n=1 Tax=Aquimarina addita TaxID=870485 RepID=UPI0031F0924C
MKYNKFSKKGQEDRSHLLFDIFGILSEGLYTSVVNPLLKMITDIIGIHLFITIFPNRNEKRSDVAIKSSHTAYKVCFW